MQRKIQARNKVLMDSQFWYEEGVSYIFRMHQQMNLAIYGNGHLSCDNVILRIGIVRCIQPKEILACLTDHVGMSGAKFPIRSGVAEVESELPGLDLKRHCIGARRSEIDTGPSLGAKCAERQNLCSHQKKSSYDQTHGPTREIFYRLAGLGLGELPYKNGKQNLRCQEENSSFCHRLRHLLVNRSAMRRNILRGPPCVSHNGNRG